MATPLDWPASRTVIYCDRVAHRLAPDFCHCGGVPVWHAATSEHGVGGFTRGLCADCDAVRCDAYPGACRP